MIRTVILLILVMLVSCKPAKNDAMQTGVVNGSVSYTEFPNPKSIIAEHEDSIDVDNDLSYEFVFSKYFIPILSSVGLETKVSKRQDIQILLSATGQYPACLNYKDPIGPSSKWSGIEQNQYILQSWECNSGSYTCTVTGTFGNVTGKYLAFKKGESFGWILLDNLANGALIIKGYAISN